MRTHRSALSRRQLFALGAGGLLLPRRVLAAPSVAERKFVFVFCPGGWDTTMVFAPIFNETTDHDAGSVAAAVGDLAFTDSEQRPSVRAFFERWGDRTSVVNGVQVPSLAHAMCTRWMMTGNAQSATDDWVSVVAGNSAVDRILPNLHVSGPLFPHRYASASVRIGAVGQLPGLLDGSVFERSETALRAPPPDRQTLEEAFIRARVDSWAASAPAGQPARFGAAEQLALVRAARLDGLAAELDPGSGDLDGAAAVAVRALSSGLSRTCMFAFGVGANGIWDTHSGNDLQTIYYESLFATLGRLLEGLAAASGEASGSLLDETTVVVLSEMGRTPEMNSTGGKDHWPWTSAMFVGSGISGGRTIGAWTEEINGEPVDLASGEASADGVTLLPGHLGATILALADIDPAEHVNRGLGDVIPSLMA